MLDNLLAQDVTDSTDFPDDATTPGLRSFDDALRCPVCRDFYDAPISLTCGHCFCSAVRECHLLSDIVAKGLYHNHPVHTLSTSGAGFMPNMSKTGLRVAYTKSGCGRDSGTCMEGSQVSLLHFALVVRHPTPISHSSESLSCGTPMKKSNGRRNLSLRCVRT